MKHFLIIIIFLSLPLFLMAEGARPNDGASGSIGRAAEGVTYTIKPSVSQEGGLYFLAAEGATNLPDEVILDITFTYQFPGSDNERYLDYKRCRVADSAYETKLGPFKRKPPAGQYLFKVTFDPARQPDNVSKYLEGKYKALESMAKTETMIVGKSTDDAQAERRQMLNIVKKEGLTLKAIFDDIKAHAPEYIRTPRAAEPQRSPDNFGEDIKALRQWSEKTTAKLESLVSAILLEDELRVFEMVTQAKAQIENSAFLLKSLMQKQDEILAFKEQTIKDMEEFNRRKLTILLEEVVVLSILTDKEVTKNLKELGIFSLNKDVLLASLGKIEQIITKAPENDPQGHPVGGPQGQPLKDADKSALMQEMVALSQNLPDIFYDQLHQLVSEVIGVIKGNQPMTKQVKEGILNRIKTFRSEIESSTNY